MALTKNLNRTGSAASFDRQQARQLLLVDICSARLDFADALRELKRADPDWENWFDDDRNIPPQILWTDRRLVDELIQRIHQRIRQVQPAPTGYPNHDRP